MEFIAGEDLKAGDLVRLDGSSVVRAKNEQVEAKPKLPEKIDPHSEDLLRRVDIAFVAINQIIECMEYDRREI